MWIFGKKERDESLETKKNWYSDRYQTVTVQRNFLALITFFSLVGIVVSVLSVVHISNSKTIEPFVIEIEERTGITNVIRPLEVRRYAYNDALRRYFLVKYLNAREGYNPNSFEYDYFKVVRLLSESNVYAAFRRAVYANSPESPLRLGQNRQRAVDIRSIVYLDDRQGPGFTAQVRFRSRDIAANGSASNEKHKVATITFNFMDLVMTEEERSINPLGFQILSYRVDDEVVQ